ncbi:MAG: hypothetical protein EA398_18110 [Deltaproteobacteria bacterium]|nr:MAG: hypothetical protein EA398_18110 [Deltaproteobacteria bacterium]
MHNPPEATRVSPAPPTTTRPARTGTRRSPAPATRSRTGTRRMSEPAARSRTGTRRSPAHEPFGNTRPRSVSDVGIDSHPPTLFHAGGPASGRRHPTDRRSPVMHSLLLRSLPVALLGLTLVACGSSESGGSAGGDTDSISSDAEPTAPESDVSGSGSADVSSDETSTPIPPDGSRVPPPLDAPIAQRCTYACDLLEECGYLDLGAGFGGGGGLPPGQSFDCMQLCQGLPVFGQFIGIDGTEIQTCLTQATNCENARACDTFGFIPELDQECVRACRELDAKLDECGPPIQLEQVRAADGLHTLEPADLSHAFRFTPEAYREVLEIVALFPRTFTTWETPDRHIVTLDGHVHGGLLDALRTHAGLLAEYPTYFTPNHLRVVVTDRAVVRFTERPEDGIEKLLGEHELEIVEPLRIGGDGWVVRNTSDQQGFLRRLLRLGEVKGVDFAEPDFLRSYVAHDTIEDPLFEMQWHLTGTGRPGVQPHSGIDAVRAWRLTLGDPSIVIAINDDGVDSLHPDFEGRIVEGLYEPANLDAALNQCCSHGTAVAGVAAAGANDIGGRGVCPGCSIMPMYANIIGFNSSDSDVANSFTDAANAGAAVQNNSWGLSTGSIDFVTERQYSGGPLGIPSVVNSAITTAATEARDGRGMVIVFASGNDNSLSDYFNHHPHTISVGASDDQGRKATYSSWSPVLDVLAPSQGGRHGITTTDIRGSRGYNRASGDAGDYTNDFGGTSSAAPVVTGLIGLMLSANPDLTAEEVRTILHETSEPLDRLNALYDEDGRSDAFGFGLINAYRAVWTALDRAGECIPAEEEECTGVSDTCSADGPDAGCPVLGACEPCIADAECGADALCVRPPNEARPFCLAACSDDTDCGTDETCTEGACIPPFGRCTDCADTEECNGFDDTCTGTPDADAAGNLACSGNARQCNFDTECGPDQVCAGNGCYTPCESDDQCAAGSNARCVPGKDRHGRALETDICVDGLLQSCVSLLCIDSVNDPSIGARLRACIDVAGDDCAELYECRPEQDD